MKPLSLALALFVLATAAAPAAVAETRRARLVLVVHAENKVSRLDKSSVRNMYLGITTFWHNDVRVKPYNRVHDGAAGKPFFRDVLGMTPARYRHTWQKQQLSGQGVEPEVVTTAGDVVARVASSPGAIGYILDSETAAADARVRLIPLEGSP
jgi:ABC-type phosphate transport system substrate-binding protein